MMERFFFSSALTELTVLLDVLQVASQERNYLSLQRVQTQSDAAEHKPGGAGGPSPEVTKQTILATKKRVYHH